MEKVKNLNQGEVGLEKATSIQCQVSSKRQNAAVRIYRDNVVARPTESGGQKKKQKQEKNKIFYLKGGKDE